MTLKALPTIRLAAKGNLLAIFFASYKPVEKNLVRDSANSIIIVSLCDRGYSKRLDCTYSYYNSPQMCRLMRIASGLWGDEAVNDSGVDAVRNNAKWFLDRCWLWSEGIGKYWFRDAMDDTFLLFKLMLFFAVLAPFAYVVLSRKPWEALIVFAVVACIVYSIPVLLLDHQEYGFIAILYFPPSILIVWAICHAIWRFRYRRVDVESKK